MKLIEKYETDGTPVFVIIHWGDHWPACEKCREVSLDKPATFSNSCAQGSVLIAEEMVKRQAPVVKHKAQEVKEWARRTGVFKGAE